MRRSYCLPDRELCVAPLRGVNLSGIIYQQNVLNTATTVHSEVYAAVTRGAGVVVRSRRYFSTVWSVPPRVKCPTGVPLGYRLVITIGGTAIDTSLSRVKHRVDDPSPHVNLCRAIYRGEGT